ncbi:MAG: branched-chain amino acid aminotransferase [Nocardioidaceae bacterium]|jgi:branched-chain amino acid aminotransferase|nr:branched-chain amino acid aminotransferase [Nocardioidaceae bacterium]
MRAWCNGEVVDPRAPALSVLDHGITVGDGVFEAVKVVENLPFALTRHLRRMTRSARGLGLPEPDQELVRQAIKVTLADQDLQRGLIRITYTAGISPVGSNRATESPTLVVIAKTDPPRKRRTAAVTVPWPRNERGALAGLKTTSYGENVVALAYAEQHDATEAIFANTLGSLCEGTGTNVFCVSDGVVATPPLSSGCLAGITRELVMEWYDVHERDISMAELAAADEVFLTSTTRDVQGVKRLDGRTLKKGKVTRAVAEEWARREVVDLDP